MVKDAQKAVGVRREIDAGHVRFLVYQMVDESGVLVGVAVVVLLPDVGGENIVQRGDLGAPGELARDLEPFRVLGRHGVHDADESLVAVEKAVAPGQKVTLQPALAAVLGKHGVHHPAVRREQFIVGKSLRAPGAPSRLKDLV